jgi:hypothetical protein
MNMVRNKRIIDVVLEKRQKMIDDPTEAIRNGVLAVAAIHGGVRSAAWRAYMMQFVDQDPLGTPVDKRQLDRLLATDGTDGNPDMDRHRAYLLGNGPCGPDTPTTFHATINTIDDGIAGDLAGAMSDVEMSKAVPASKATHMKRTVVYK